MDYNRNHRGDVISYSRLSSNEYASWRIYKHPIARELEEQAKKVGGHGGLDFMMDYRLIYCLQNGLHLDMDVYDLVEWCSFVSLAAISLENNSAPVGIPDFTRSAWNKLEKLQFARIKE